MSQYTNIDDFVTNNIIVGHPEKWLNNHITKDILLPSITSKEVNLLPSINCVFEACKIHAELKNSIALNNLGEFYFYGCCTTRDMQKALDCFKESASLGCSQGMANVGYMYLNYFHKVDEAIQFYSQSAEYNNKFAIAELITIYMGIPKPKVKI